MPRVPVLKLLALVFVLTLLGSALLLQFDWNGTAASEEAGPIDTLLDVMIVLSTFVFAVVMVMLGYSLWKFRARPGDMSDGEPIHGHTKLEIVWTAIPTAIVTAAAVYSAVVLANIEERDSDRMVVDVVSQQFAWRFEYPEAKVKSNELVVPVDRQVEFRLHAKDVLHSFWVPAWRIKKDTVPGITTRAYVTPNKLGSYPVVCAELCGLGHSTMRARATVVSQKEYDEWVAEQQADQGVEGAEKPAAAGGGPQASAPSAQAAAGRQVFQAQGCASCHTLAAAESESGIGPNLDRGLAGKNAEFIREAIVAPDAEIASGFSAGIMPKTFGDQLSEKELDSLVEFLMASVKD